MNKKIMSLAALVGFLVVIYLLFFNKQGVTEPGSLATANTM